MTKTNLEFNEKYDFADFVDEYVGEKKLLTFSEVSMYLHLTSLKKREKKYSLSDLAKWYGEDEKAIVESLERLENCKLIEHTFDN